MKPKVIIGCPIQNREWALPQYLGGIVNQTFPKKQTVLYFYANNCTDGTAEALRKFARAYSDKYAGIYIDEAKIYKGRQDPQDRNKKRDYTLFAVARNGFLKNVKTIMNVLQGATHLFSVDSDVVLPPKALDTLLSEEKDMISLLLYNGTAYGLVPGADEIGVDFYNIAAGPDENNNFYPIPGGEVKANGKAKVSVTGACVLMTSEVINCGAMYQPHPQGEDIPFCIEVIKQGYEIWCKSEPSPQHLRQTAYKPK